MGRDVKGAARRIVRDPRVDQLAAELAATKDLVAQINHNVAHLVSVTDELRQRFATLDEVTMLARHLNAQAEQTREQVEIISALTLALQRQTEQL